jgi:hypothetical protein
VANGIKQVDFLDGIAGLDTQAVQRRAATITLASGADPRVQHPLDVLESRLQNLRLIAGKPNAGGIAQARLSVSIARSFLLRLIEEAASTRVIFDAIERIGQIATNKRLTGVMLDYNVDVLSAVPAENRAIGFSYRAMASDHAGRGGAQAEVPKATRPPVSAGRAVTAPSVGHA